MSGIRAKLWSGISNARQMFVSDHLSRSTCNLFEVSGIPDVPGGRPGAITASIAPSNKNYAALGVPPAGLIADS